VTEGHRSAPGGAWSKKFAVVAQLVERVLGKDEVTGSTPVNGSRLKWYVYLLRSVPTGRHYIGMTSDVPKRLHEHNTKTGRWTSSFKPWDLLGLEEFETRGAAMKREAFLKSREGIAERQKLFEQLESVRVERP
jgi:putative endonuclease